MSIQPDVGQETTDGVELSLPPQNTNIDWSPRHGGKVHVTGDINARAWKRKQGVALWQGHRRGRTRAVTLDFA